MVWSPCVNVTDLMGSKDWALSLTRNGELQSHFWCNSSLVLKLEVRVIESSVPKRAGIAGQNEENCDKTKILKDQKRHSSQHAKFSLMLVPKWELSSFENQANNVLVDTNNSGSSDQE